jgi:hypothetical protein
MVPLSPVSRHAGVAAAGRSLVVWTVRASSVGDGGNDLPWHPDAADGLVRRRMADDRPEAWDLGARTEADAGDRLRADRVGDAAPLPHRDGAPWSGATPRNGRGRRDVPGRPRARGSWPRRAGQGDGRSRGRARGPRTGTLPAAGDSGCRRRDAAGVHARPRGAWLGGDHRWTCYRPACEGYDHRPEPIGPSGQQAHELLPAVHRVASLVQRWLLDTHQGGVKPAHMQAYLDEFTFRFNRRRSRARGMLFYRLLDQAVQAEPRTYRSLVADPGSGRTDRLPPPPHKRVRPASLDGDPVDRPWRKTTR